MSETEEALRQSVTLLIDLQECLNNVASRLESKKDVPHVERFPEKNLLTHDCIGLLLSCILTQEGLYDKWYKAQTNWVYHTCHGSSVDGSKCNLVRDKFIEKNKMVSFCWEFLTLRFLNQWKKFSTKQLKMKLLHTTDS